MKRLRWEKRLKWFKVSRMVIPIALAISLIFVGFTVYADEAQNFVIRTQEEGDVRLSLTMQEDLSRQTSVLSVPFVGSQTNSSFDPLAPGYEDYLYDSENNNEYNIPNNIAQLSGQHFGTYYDQSGTNFTYSAFSFWLVNNSERAVDVDIIMNLDGLMTNYNDYDHHIDDVLRVMFIEGSPLLTDNTYTVYAKAEDPEHPWHDDALLEDSSLTVNYDSVDFESETCIFRREGDLGLRNLAAGAAIKYTVVLWLEGNDEQCTSHIFGERAKLSIDFVGH